MVKTLSRTGNSLALILDKPLLEATGIDAETLLEVSTDGDVIVIAPVRGATERERFRAAAAAITERFAGVFRRLAE